MENKNKNKKRNIFLCIMVLLFLVLSILVVFEKTNSIDLMFHSFILDIRCDFLTTFFTFITNLGGASCLLAVGIILLILMKNKKNSLYILINLVLAFITNEVIKSIFVRTRPIGINLVEESGYSFPSGHSMVSLAFYGFIVYLLLKQIKNKIYRRILIIGLSLLTLLIGFSRIYLGVHYLSDVIGGFILSIIYLMIFINTINKLEKK